MGWEQGKSFSKYETKVVAPIEYLPRQHRLGLGATPKLPSEADQKKEKSRLKRPGEKEKKYYTIAAGEGKSKNYRSLDDELIEIKPLKWEKDALVAIKEGSHAGLFARVIDVPFEDKYIPVRLLINDQVNDVKKKYMQLVNAQTFKGEIPPTFPLKRLCINKLHVLLLHVVDLIIDKKTDRNVLIFKRHVNDTGKEACVTSFFNGNKGILFPFQGLDFNKFVI
eukprot:TRINITY_DN5433_c0_g1_i1.p1 TRINITY_DN5433_c0_g1~~TRINITY_DN5433_c0_g1_i1.p1  ORF type:complete len:251 (+),score=58.40 TRINITY_DN5433_c0_g1_i1:85-753(+)